MARLVPNEQGQRKDCGDAVCSDSERTCVGCREKTAPEDLERFVFVPEAGLLYDVRQKAPGRGAYVHARPECVERAIKRGGFARSFRTNVGRIDPEDLVEQMRQGIRRRLQESLQSGLIAGKIEVGGQRLKEAMRADEVKLLIVARDAGESTRQKFLRNADRKEIPTVDLLSGEQLGKVSRRDFVAVMGVADSGFAERIARDVHKLIQLGAFEG